MIQNDYLLLRTWRGIARSTGTDARFLACSAARGHWIRVRLAFAPDITNQFPLEVRKRVAFFFFFFFFGAFLSLLPIWLRIIGIVFLFPSRLCHIKRSFFNRATSFTLLSELLGVSDAMALRNSLSLVIAAALFLAVPFASKLFPAYSVFARKIPREDDVVRLNKHFSIFIMEKSRDLWSGDVKFGVF